MINDNLNENIISFSSAELVLAPKSSAYYRCVLSEGTCDPIISDAILVQSMGSTLFDDVINVKDEPFHISVDSIEVTIPKALTDESFRLTITKLDNPPTAPDTCKMASVYDVSVSFGSVFDLPIEIKLKNLKLSELDLMKIPDYRPVYFDDKAQKWVEYNNGGLILSDSSIYFRTHHLTKLSFWEKILNPTYTHRHINDKVEVIYKYRPESKEDIHYERYQILNINNKVPKPWHNSNIDPDMDGTPYLIQDVAGYMNQVIKSFENAGFKYPANRRFIIYVSNLGEGILNKLTGVSNSF
ncbi:MAG TPA: hypothetical protein VFD91_09875, partial [Mariniphaga sp.]|nr:hypothetical protein [Mariniphaga sp.]